MECKIGNVCKYGFKISCNECSHYLLSVIHSQEEKIKSLLEENKKLVEMHNNIYKEVLKIYEDWQIKQ